MSLLNSVLSRSGPSALPAVFATRSTARHARPARFRPLVAAGGLTAAILLGEAAALAGPASASGAESLARLRQCESGGNYSINTGNGYYGAYQFDASTWRGLGFSGLPHHASPETQDAAAIKLQAQRGWSPWPACSRRLGLRGSASAGSSSTSSGSSGSSPAAPAKPAKPVDPGTSTAFTPEVTLIGQTVRVSEAKAQASARARAERERAAAAAAAAAAAKEKAEAVNGHWRLWTPAAN